MSGDPYDVLWFKDPDSVRVEDNPINDNMWTFYDSSDSRQKLEGGITSTSTTFQLNLKKYDLIIFYAKTADAGTYYCKAVSRKDSTNSVLLGTTTLTVSGRMFSFT